MAAMPLSSALAIARAALRGGLPLGAPASGQTPVCFPASRASQHFWMLLSLARAKRATALPIACWQRFQHRARRAREQAVVIERDRLVDRRRADAPDAGGDVAAVLDRGRARGIRGVAEAGAGRGPAEPAGGSSLVGSPPQIRSAPPQALAIAAASLPLALAIRTVAAASGHVPAPVLTTVAAQRCWILLSVARNFEACFAMAR
jgi:hypothetical protein